MILQIVPQVYIFVQCNLCDLAMKIKEEHFIFLKNAVAETLSVHNSRNELVIAYERGEFHNSEKTKDLQRRFCFDILYGSGLTKWVCKTLYPYLNDDHIYTALKAICPQVVDRRRAGEASFARIQNTT